MSKIISGKQVSDSLLERAKTEISQLNQEGIEVSLAVIVVGDDPASRVYVNNKKKACERIGIVSYEYALGFDTTQEELLTLIEKLNNDDSIKGILCQLPLPKHLNETQVIEAISTEKDVDCFHPENVGAVMIGNAQLLPCTPAGVMEMLRFAEIDLEGKNCVVIGRSNIVGKPLSLLLLHANATVTICHSKTRNLADITSQADIVIAAVGVPKFVGADMVKDGAVVVDVGIHRMENGKLCGDVDFEEVSKKASFITPVPGGVGPMTIAYLMMNTITAAKLQNK